MSGSLATVSYIGATILFILCLGGQFLVRELPGQTEQIPETVRPVELAAAVECLGVDLEQFAGPFGRVLWIVSI